MATAAEWLGDKTPRGPDSANSLGFIPVAYVGANTGLRSGKKMVR